MLTPEMERQSCLRRAEEWCGEAGIVREHAQLPHLRPEQRDVLLRSAEACDRMAGWWLTSAEDYVADTAGTEPEKQRS